MLVRRDGFLPKERYTTSAFAAAEFDRLWPRVWQVAAREEELPEPGDFVEYGIGRDSIAIVRTETGDLAAFHNACLHRGTRLAHECGHFDGEIRCPYHAWRYALDGRLVDVPDRDEFPGLPSDLALKRVQVDTWGGFVFVNMDLEGEPLLEFLDPLPKLLAPYHLDQMRFRAYRTTIIPANWKAVVDAFNESYHVQGTHPEILPWTDDVSIEYEQFGLHAHYGRLPNARRQLRPSPRLGHAMTYDPQLGRTVIFGGENGLPVLRDTWAWDGRDWQRVATSTAPDARAFPSAAFDRGQGAVVLFGGRVSPQPQRTIGDTWSIDATSLAVWIVSRC